MAGELAGVDRRLLRGVDVGLVPPLRRPAPRLGARRDALVGRLRLAGRARAVELGPGPPHERFEGRIPPVPVYLDSPLAIQVTEIYKSFQSYFNSTVSDPDHLRDGVFNFPNLHKTLTTEESRAIADRPGRKIIIAGSGMSNGGRIIHHEKHYLSNPSTALLLIGYQAAGSLGRLLEEGATGVTILGTRVQVRAKVVSLSGYSAHRDGPHLLEFVHEVGESLEMVYTAMGEPKSSLFLAQRIRDYLGIRATVPRLGESVNLDL